ncbi:hypothetical protein MIND_00191000 [Mycena indigotica]|uniref:Uncharacterized protein n=1 Tax=Mycena indigotica TaxID=2126181 RepID=A0A8H6T6I3_9AGAR|nr:uncharacterized protein MIND_00191000 [Mycena indigotica]KAF7311805.1 hypothetical protein MIND_00191000 [Mycena indigotica]
MDAEPRFPFELEKEVFETAALAYPETIPTLLLVARRVSVWVEPFLYRTSPTFIANAVRCLVLDYSCPINNGTLSLLARCTRVTAVGMNAKDTADTLLPALAALPLQRFAGFLSHLLPTDLHAGGGLTLNADDTLAHTFWQQLTHLDVFETLDTARGRAARALLPRLPRLTHLAVGHAGVLPVIRHLLVDTLQSCAHLQVLVVLGHPNVAGSGKQPLPRLLRDPRVVILVRADLTWDDSVLPTPNLWTTAEQFLQRKRRNEVGPDEYWA